MADFRRPLLQIAFVQPSGDDVESGSIILWSGAIVDIPTGYVICDGNNGSPDLRNKFIIGAGDGYAVNANGGSTSHDHTFSGSPHQHTLPGGVDIPAGAGFSAIAGQFTATGTVNSKATLPPYLSLAYIMKT